MASRYFYDVLFSVGHCYHMGAVYTADEEQNGRGLEDHLKFIELIQYANFIKISPLASKSRLSQSL